MTTLRLIGTITHGLLAGTVLLTLMAGLPWALIHFVGWPLPNHLPSKDEIETTLLNPINQRFLLNSMAVLCWIVWFIFVADVLHCSIDAVRGATWQHLRPPGPLRALAIALIGAIVLTLLSNRTGSTTPLPTTRALTIDPLATVTTAPLNPDVMAQPAPPGMVQITEEVRPPQDGIHDNLWRVAERIYGTGNRWPELYQLNRGVQQPDGRTLVNPNLIRPGWKITAYLTVSLDKRSPENHPPQDSSHNPPPTTTAPTTPPSATSTQAPTETEQPGDNHSGAQAAPALDLGTGAFVSIGLVVLVTVALTAARLHQRRRYRPGRPIPDDPGQAPIVRALRIAYDSVALPPDNDPPTRAYTAADDASLPEREARDHAQTTARAFQPGPNETAVGVREGHTVALNIARNRGLGLTGPGAHATACALIVNILTRAATANGDALVIVPVAESHAMFGQGISRHRSSCLRVVDTLTAALDTLEAELLNRMRRTRDPQSSRNSPLVLVATPTADTERRTQAILDNGATFNLTGIILGQWRAGGTAHVRDDGTITATSPNLDDQLSGTRLFTLPSTDAADLFALLHAAEPTPEPVTPSADYEFLAPTTNEPEDTNPAPHDAPSPSTPKEQAPTSTPGVPPLHLQVLGQLHLTHTRTDPVDLINSIAPRQREILVYLALHRAGCRRESLTTALWPDAPGDRPYNSFHATLSQLRQALRKAAHDSISTVIVNDDGHYRLDKTLVTVDLWQLQDALTARHQAPTQAKRLTALRQIADLYRGDLADRITADWIDLPREALRRDALDALSVMIRAVDDDPEQMLTLLERARRMDPYNEAIYRDLMRVQARLDRYDSIPRTLNLLATSLADLGLRPTQDTAALSEFLQKSHANQQRGREAS